MCNATRERGRIRRAARRPDRRRRDRRPGHPVSGGSHPTLPRGVDKAPSPPTPGSTWSRWRDAQAMVKEGSRDREPDEYWQAGPRDLRRRGDLARRKLRPETVAVALGGRTEGGGPGSRQETFAAPTPPRPGQA